MSIIEKLQVAEKLYADALLLIVAMLSSYTLTDLIVLSHKLGMRCRSRAYGAGGKAE